MKQAKEMKLNPREYHSIHHSGVFRDPLGDVADYVVGQSDRVEGMKLGDSGLIVDLLKKANVSEPMYPWAPAYVASFQILQAALENAGTLDNEAVMAALKSLKLATCTGQQNFTRRVMARSTRTPHRYKARSGW